MPLKLITSQGQKSSSMNVLSVNFQKNVCYAYSIAEQLYHHYQGKMPEKDIRKMIIEAISALKCSQAYAHVFINDLNGNGIYYSA
ncbi:MAG: cache domain-containing protein [Mangrovibacterium sp.]